MWNKKKLLGPFRVTVKIVCGLAPSEKATIWRNIWSVPYFLSKSLHPTVLSILSTTMPIQCQWQCQHNVNIWLNAAVSLKNRHIGSEVNAVTISELQAS